MIAKARGWPLPVARSEAIADLVRMQAGPSAGVVVLADHRRAITSPSTDLHPGFNVSPWTVIQNDPWPGTPAAYYLIGV